MKVALNVKGNSRKPVGLALLRQRRGVTGHQGVDRSLDFIAENYRRPFRVFDLAGVAGLSRRGFIKAFTKHVGVRPLSLLTHARMEHAKDLLAESDLPLAVVAQQCGYRRFNSFWVAFRRMARMAPGAFRKRTQQQRQLRRQ